MKYIHFVLVAEGATDIVLQDHLERLLVWLGAEEVVGVAPDLDLLPDPVGHDVKSKVKAALSLEPEANLLFVHRDADGREAEPRRSEIEVGIKSAGCQIPYVPVVPIQETEAWLLLDEAAIRRVVGRPTGSTDLSLPAPAAVEAVANPKEVLHAALRAASESTGRSRDRVNRQIPEYVRQLLIRLPVNGPIEYLQAWQRLNVDIEAAIQYL